MNNEQRWSAGDRVPAERGYGRGREGRGPEWERGVIEKLPLNR